MVALCPRGKRLTADLDPDMPALTSPLKRKRFHADSPVLCVNHVRANGGFTEAEQIERLALGLPPASPAAADCLGGKNGASGGSLSKRAIRAPHVLNEAPAYGSAFTRGLRVDLPGGVTHLLISGTASVGE